MANTIISPNRYVQGRGELKNLPEHAKKLGKKLFVIISFRPGSPFSGAPLPSI